MFFANRLCCVLSDFLALGLLCQVGVGLGVLGLSSVIVVFLSALLSLN
jgi:hypothetical protein